MRQPTASHIYERLFAIEHRLDRYYRLRASDHQLLVAIAQKLDVLTGLEVVDLALGVTMSRELDELTNEVEVVKTTQASAIAALNRVADLILEDAGNKAKMVALAADLKASSAQLALAIDAQAPAQPPIVIEPEPPVEPAA